jgi:hypothetical protein
MSTPMKTMKKLITGGLAAAAIALIPACGVGHSEAWQYGNSHAGMARQLVTQGSSVERACTTVAAQSAMFTEVDEINLPDAYDGCMAGF